jgi:hypothetical protein
MKSATLSILLVISLAIPVFAVEPPPKYISPDISLDQEVTRFQAVETINNAMSWWEDYRINSCRDFWKRLWYGFQKFIGYLTTDIDYLAQVSKSEHTKEIFIANRWGIRLADSDVDKPVAGWEILELESQALSKALNASGIGRNLTDEVNQIRSELGKISRQLDASYKPLIDEGLISGPKTEFKPGNDWVYYLFSIQHDLLPHNPDNALRMSIGQLNMPVTGRQLEAYAAKLVNLLRQMADDLN